MLLISIFIRIQDKFHKEMAGSCQKLKDLKEQMDVCLIEKTRLQSQIATIKEHTKKDAKAFEEKLKHVLIQIEKNKEELTRAKESKSNQEYLREQNEENNSGLEMLGQKSQNKVQVDLKGYHFRLKKLRAQI